MLGKHFLIAALFFSSFNLLAQQYVDVFPDGIYIQEYSDFKGSGIVKINHDLSVEHFLPPVLPKDFDLRNLIAGIRLKIRLDSFWISDKRKIYKRPLDAVPGQEWELVKTPDELTEFFDFEVISDKEIVIGGGFFKPYEINGTKIPQPRKHAIFNYKTGAVTTTIESFDFNAFPYGENDVRSFYVLIKQYASYICRFDSKIVIVGEYSGFVTVLDINPDNGRLRSYRKFRIIPEDELPRDPTEAINNGSAISWIGPLSGDDVLICCRKWVVSDKKPSKPVSVQCFRKLNLKTGKVTFENTVYRDRKAENYLTLFEENGELLSAREYMQRCIEQSKKPKSTPVPGQTEKQVGQPPKAGAVGIYP
jgi:hypothetical protein